MRMLQCQSHSRTVSNIAVIAATMSRCAAKLEIMVTNGASNVPDPDELLKPPTVSDMVKLAPRTLSDMRWKGTGPAFIKLSPGKGGRIRYRRRDVESWLQERAVRSSM